MKSRIVGQIIAVDYDFDNKELKIGFIKAKHEPYLLEADNVLENFLKLGHEEPAKLK